MTNLNVFVGRQPILDIHENIYGYELLYRSSEKNAFPEINPDEATIGLIINTFLSIGIDKVNDEGLSFINFTGNLLAQDIFDNLDPKRVVIEILENVEITEALKSKVRLLKEQGFQIAMDDFVMEAQYENHLDLFNHIDYIKIDFFCANEKERHVIEEFARKFPQIRLIAEKIETREDYEYAKKFGYTLFQGYYFAKPEIISGYEIPSNMHVHFRVIEKLNAYEPSIREIAEFIKQDVSLSYKLLRFINTYSVGIPRRINSINQAIIVIGLNEMKKWMHVLALRDIGESSSSGRVKALVQYSLTRARICELLAKEKGKENPESYFLVGMFSLMDVIMRKDWSDVLMQLPLTDDVACTLVGIETEMTPYLELSKAIEQFDLGKVKTNAEAIGVNYVDLYKYTQQANRWTQRLK